MTEELEVMRKVVNFLCEKLDVDVTGFLSKEEVEVFEKGMRSHGRAIVSGGDDTSDDECVERGRLKDPKVYDDEAAEKATAASNGDLEEDSNKLDYSVTGITINADLQEDVSNVEDGGVDATEDSNEDQGTEAFIGAEGENGDGTGATGTGLEGTGVDAENGTEGEGGIGNADVGIGLEGDVGGGENGTEGDDNDISGSTGTGVSEGAVSDGESGEESLVEDVGGEDRSRGFAVHGIDWALVMADPSQKPVPPGHQSPVECNRRGLSVFDENDQVERVDGYYYGKKAYRATYKARQTYPKRRLFQVDDYWKTKVEYTHGLPKLKRKREG